MPPEMEAAFARVALVGEDHKLAQIMLAVAQQEEPVLGVPLVLLVGDHEVLSVALAVDASELDFLAGPHNMEAVADIQALHRLVHDAILVAALDAERARLVVERKFRLVEAAFEAGQRLALMEAEQQR